MDISAPDHPQYGMHCEEHELRELLKPSYETSSIAISWLQDNNITLIEDDNDYILFRTNVESANQFLETEFGWYYNPEESHEVLRTLAYSVPEEIQDHINFVQPTTRFGSLKPLSSTAQLIDKGEANQTAVPWILDEFSQMWETPFDPTNQSFPCSAQRPPNLSDADAKTRLYLTNHNLNYDISLLGNSLLMPNLPLLNVTNKVTGFGSLGVGAQECFDDWGYAPKFLNVDYYNVGNGSVFEVAAKYNNVTYNRPCCGVANSGVARTRELSGWSWWLGSL